jgi:biotin-(acetyl-CoA carboxylase) ligase
VSRTVAIGTFDGVHLGHRAVVRAAIDAGLTPTVVTFDPHPRTVLGRPVQLLATLERRLGEPAADAFAALRERDALLDRPVAWAGGEGVAAGIDDAGALLVRRADGDVVALDAGEVHLR